VLNDKLFDVMGDDAEMDKCFQCADDVLNNAVQASPKSSTSTAS
jgi:cell division protein FtsZ